MKDWLVEHGIVKSDAQLQREKLQKLMVDNYSNAKDTVWGSWRDSDMRDWLIEHGYLKSDAQKTRDELVGMMHDKYVTFSLVYPHRLTAHFSGTMTTLLVPLLTSHGPTPVCVRTCVSTVCPKMHSRHLVPASFVR